MKPKELPKAYSPSGIEEKWYSIWEKAGYFHVEASDSRKPFSLVIPPPNVTGSLHMGHALDNTLQDIVVRYKRMDGFATLWLPGTDHAGIATQNVVEKHLAEKKISRHDLGREKFVEKVWEWKKNYGGVIVHQLRRLGASCDWSRERFTMDEGLSLAVRTVFVTLYNEGLIYRSNYLISWCPRCHTALSDLEVDYQEIDGQLTYFDYETTDGERITVATTRPETMLGDSAIAVHPKDDRFSKHIGKTIRHPFLKRDFPVIADEFVDPKFGTGAVKVTPAHDPNDYAMGNQHKLEFITVIDTDGCMTKETGAYAGLDRYKARKKVVADLKAKNLYQKQDPYRHSVGHCQRCHTVVEPRISKQWFVRIEKLAKPAIAAVKKGNMEFVPNMWTKTYLSWMENIRDWCISRQLWWGHRIPVWYCGDCSEMTVALETPTQCQACNSKKLTQDPDVLDTWFSSALWPFSTMGWPENTADLKKFYPTTLLITGFDIIFFWVARMMMMGLKFMKEPPFHRVHIHALIRDAQGKKMSKSKGNVVDPLEIMDRYGTDAFRFALAAFSVQGRDISLSEQRIEGYRNFMNKIWNAARFALQSIGDASSSEKDVQSYTMPDQWIRSRLNEVIDEVRKGFDELRFSDAAEALYQFTWHELCDWYLELIKPHFRPDASAAERESSTSTLLYVLDQILRLMHPITPFITEEIWLQLPRKRTTETIMLAEFPKADGYRDKKAIDAFETIRGVVDTIRNIRSENKIPPSKKVKVAVRPVQGKAKKLLESVQSHVGYICEVARIEAFEVEPKEVSKTTARKLSGDLEVLVPLEGLVDTDKEKERLEKEKKKASEDHAFLERRLADENYRKKAPEKVIQRDEQKLADAKLRLEKIQQSLAALR